MKSIDKHSPIGEAFIVNSIQNAQHLDHDNDKIPVYPCGPVLALWSLLHNWMADQAQRVWWLVKVKVMVNVMMVVLMAVKKKTETDKGTAPQVPSKIESSNKRMVPMNRTWQRDGLPSTPPTSHNLLDKEAEQEHHVPVKRNRKIWKKKSHHFKKRVSG